MTSPSPPARPTYLGLFAVTMATLMHEILLTRIFSVSMWYHFAFLAISVAMFGMTVGALAVYLYPHRFPIERTHESMAAAALGFSVTMVLSFLTHLSIPFIVGKSFVLLYAIAFNYAVLALPFCFSGVCVCLALTRFPSRLGRLYGADLVGAAAGCAALVGLLNVTDGPTAVFVVAALSAAGAAAFVWRRRSPRLKVACAAVAAALLAFAAANTALANRQRPWLRMLWVKGKFEERGLYTKWNSYSRIRIEGDPDALGHPLCWGLSPRYRSEPTARQLLLTIDASAGTVLTGFDGDWSKVEYLKYDVTNVAHHLRTGGRVLVVGAGGGRDVLSALAFGQREVEAVEINGDIIDAVNERFGDFTGHLDRQPGVRFVVDEARSYIARSREPYDLIQVSLIDTWAATAAGAFVLTENSLYTVEAWQLFLERLTDRGVLTFSRWYFADRPAEVYRLAALAVEALRRLGVEHPRRHILLVRSMNPYATGDEPDGVGTILVSRTPFSDADTAAIEALCARMGFDPVLTPTAALDPIFEQIGEGRDLASLYRAYPLNIAPPTDDSPFFFHMLRLRDIPQLYRLGLRTVGINLKAVLVLGVLLAVVIVLTGLCIVLPLALTARRPRGHGTLPWFVFFACIGLGFMLVEISQMQRLVVFLGHPVYGLSVVLFALLIASGVGSLTTPPAEAPGFVRSALGRVWALPAVLLLFGGATPHVIDAMAAASTPVRIAAAVAVLLPIGWVMGMAFPAGMGAALRRAPELAPWLWGVNGATSVLASVLAVAVALTWGISAAFWTGWALYGLAALTLTRILLTRPS